MYGKKKDSKNEASDIIYCSQLRGDFNSRRYADFHRQKEGI